MNIFLFRCINVVQIFVLKTNSRNWFSKAMWMRSNHHVLKIKQIRVKVGQTISSCDVTFWLVYLLDWWPPECRQVSENGLALLTRLRSSVLRIFTFNPFLWGQFLLCRWKPLISQHEQHARVLSKCNPRGHPHSPWPSFWSAAELSFRCLNSPFNH